MGKKSKTKGEKFISGEFQKVFENTVENPGQVKMAGMLKSLLGRTSGKIHREQKRNIY